MERPSAYHARVDRRVEIGAANELSALGSEKLLERVSPRALERAQELRARRWEVAACPEEEVDVDVGQKDGSVLGVAQHLPLEERLVTRKAQDVIKTPRRAYAWRSTQANVQGALRRRTPREPYSSHLCGEGSARHAHLPRVRTTPIGSVGPKCNGAGELRVVGDDPRRRRATLRSHVLLVIREDHLLSAPGKERCSYELRRRVAPLDDAAARWEALGVDEEGGRDRQVGCGGPNGHASCVF
eukprot:788015-Prymnesium_polylepis.1